MVLAAAFMTGPVRAQGESASGTLAYTIREASGDLVSGKLVFLQDGRRVDVAVPYDGGSSATYEATLYTATGSGAVELPAGEYEVWAGRGLEYSADVHHVTVHAGDTSSLDANLRREVDTRGFVGADMHVHVEHVEHLEERVISIVGEGLDWAVSTEHNVHVDYAPAVERLGLGDRLLTTVGNEVTTSIGHFNIFPVEPDAPPVDHRVTDANGLFARVRAAWPEAIIQVNHPRWDGGAYFTFMGVSPSSGIAIAPEYSEDFDSYELLNENRGFGWMAEPPNNTYSVRRDWHHLLNRGFRAPVFGNSDSHSIAGMLVGLPRNYVASPTENLSEVSEADLLRSIREGRVTVSRGLYVEASANGGAVGDLVPVRDGEVELRVRVQAPGWIDCTSIEIVANGEVVERLTPSSEQAVRLDTTLVFRPENDTWYVVAAEGRTPMRPLVHDAPVPITPLGVTNAIWVDADGDGRFTSIYDEVASMLRSRPNDPSGLVDRLAGDSLRTAFAVGHALQQGQDGSAALLEALLPHASLPDRLSIYRRMGALGTPEARTLLERTAGGSAGTLDRAAAALELAKAGQSRDLEQLMEYARTLPPAQLDALDFSWLDGGRPVVEWEVVGPFPFSGSDGLDEITEVERRPDARTPYADVDGSMREWRSVRAADGGTIDLVSLFGEHAKANAYGRARFESDSAGDVLFLLGSDDGVVLWLNGEEVHRNDAHRSVHVGDDVLVLPVRQGTNTVLVKVENGAGDWGFGLEIIDLLDVIGR